MLIDTLGLFKASLEPSDIDLSRHHAAFAPPRWYGSIAEAVRSSHRHPPDFLILELGEDLGGSFDEVQSLLEASGRAPVLVADPHPSRDRALVSIQRGACCWLPIPLLPAEVIAALFQADPNLRKSQPAPQPRNTHLGPATTQTPRGIWASDNTQRYPGGLTRSEARVISLATGGRNCIQIATEMGISVRTVYVHTRNIYRKLKVHSLVGAVARYHEIASGAEIPVRT